MQLAFTGLGPYLLSTKKVDQATGKVTRERTGTFSSKKFQLSPGDLVRMANLLAEKTLDPLAFASGAGKAVLAQINFAARTEAREIERRLRDREASRHSLQAAQRKARRR